MSEVMTIEEFEDIKERLETQKNQVQQSKGQLKQILKNLLDEFGCPSIEEAEKLLGKKQARQGKLEERLVQNTEKLSAMLEEFENGET